MNKDEMKMIKEMAENQKGEGCLLCNGNQCDRCRLIVETICRAGYRKIGDDEIVVKKSELGKVVISHERADIVDMLNQETRELQRATAIKEKTAREILQELYIECEYYTHGRTAIEEIAKKYGIELED